MTQKTQNQIITTQCCIVGGGPAGIMLGYFLARNNIPIVVLEKWPDFFRDFRGDTIHPSTMDILHEAGLLDAFLKLPHDETREIIGYVSGEKIRLADFSHLDTLCKFIAFIPQWDFLNFISAEAKKYPSFSLRMETEALDLLKENGKVYGVRAQHKDKVIEVHSELVIGSDGRHSTIRSKTNLKIEELGSAIDVLWFRISRKPSDEATSLGRIIRGHMMVMIDRGEYWQCAFLIRKNGLPALQRDGLHAFRKIIIKLAPFLSDRAYEIRDWEQIKLLSVTVDHLQRWYEDGLLCIGDAAHAMSPIGGFGINVAIHDAVAAANILIPKFKSGKISISDLQLVQKRREKPVRKMQKLQVFMQNHLINPILESKKPTKLPWILRAMIFFKFNRQLAKIIGVGFQPEHVDKKIL